MTDKRIVAIAGKPGLYSLVSQGRNMLIVENIATGKRTPAYASDKVISLGDISIYTTGDDKPLYEVLDAVQEYAKGEPVDVKALDTPEKLRDYFGNILPEFDRERVYPTDIKKLFSWYNLLIANGVTDFKKEEIAEDKSAEASDPGTANAAATYEEEVKEDK